MTGDIILQKRSGWVGWIISIFTRSDYVHVGIGSSDVNVVHVDLYGKHFTPIEQWGSEIIVLTPTTPLTEEQQRKLWKYAVRERVRGYDLWSAVKSWLWKNPDDEKPIGKRYHCSSFVSAMYRKIGIDLVPNRSDCTTQPHDFVDSPLLKKRGVICR